MKIILFFLIFCSAFLGFEIGMLFMGRDLSFLSFLAMALNTGSVAVNTMNLLSFYGEKK